jgi:hypothetical protein
MTTDAEPGRFFVQFPHPGAEHRPAGDDMQWNVGPHGRKFLIAPGRYKDADGQLAAADLMLWGEWEPPSRIERRWPTADQPPHVLHRPYWITPSTTGFRQNTDPWVWGKQMLYSNCKQVRGPHQRETSMQRLCPGSVICFGSTIGGEFCLDTVFVIASAERWAPATANTLDVSEAFLACTADAVASRATDAAGCIPDRTGCGGEVELTLYRGATVETPIDGMYSFAPASIADSASARFARPAIRAPGLIDPTSRQSTRGSKHALTPKQVHAAWLCVVNHVLDAGLVLGVYFQTPPHRGGEHPIPAGSPSC